LAKSRRQVHGAKSNAVRVLFYSLFPIPCSLLFQCARK
jgi:hypothetical protein